MMRAAWRVARGAEKLKYLKTLKIFIVSFLSAPGGPG